MIRVLDLSHNYLCGLYSGYIKCLQKEMPKLETLIVDGLVAIESTRLINRAKMHFPAYLGTVRRLRWNKGTILKIGEIGPSGVNNLQVLEHCGCGLSRDLGLSVFTHLKEVNMCKAKYLL